MKKFIRFILGIITTVGITYAGFQVVDGLIAKTAVIGENSNTATIDSSGNLFFAGSGITWDDIQNLQMWDTDIVTQKPTLTAISGYIS